MTDDDAVGIVWWNAIQDYWMTRTVSIEPIERAKDASKIFKGRVGDGGAGEIAVVRLSRVSKPSRSVIFRYSTTFQDIQVLVGDYPQVASPISVAQR